MRIFTVLSNDWLLASVLVCGSLPCKEVSGVLGEWSGSTKRYKRYFALFK